MTFLLLSIGLVALTLLIVRPAVAGPSRLSFAHLDGLGIMAAFAATLAVALFLGVGFAFALMAAWMLKELGHGLGRQMVGTDGVHIRLLPLSGTPIAPKTDMDAFFVALMGPGLSLAPMVAAFAVGEAFEASAPGIAHAARSFALAAGALNFIALLPVWPLDGGRLMRLMVQARFPRLTGLSAAAAAAFVLGLSVTFHSALLFLLGLVGGLALVLRPPQSAPRPRLTAQQVRIGFGAWFALLSAFFLGGWWVLRLVEI